MYSLSVRGCAGWRTVRQGAPAAGGACCSHGLPPGASPSGVGPAVFSIGSAQVFIFVHFISDAVSPEKNSPLMVGCGYDLI